MAMRERRRLPSTKISLPFKEEVLVPRMVLREHPPPLGNCEILLPPLYDNLSHGVTTSHAGKGASERNPRRHLRPVAKNLLRSFNFSYRYSDKLYSEI
jgi:hypothetical protein